MVHEQRVALVTGGNRGMGFETCRRLGRLGYKVILSAKNTIAGEAAVSELRDEGLDVEFRHLDVTDHGETRSLVESLGTSPGRIDVLVANAGIRPEAVDYPRVTSALDADIDTVRLTLETNTLGHFTLLQRVIPIMRDQNYGRVAIVSSASARLVDMGAGMPGYRMSKVALNALARIFAAETDGENIKVNATCPNWTPMDGTDAKQNVADGVETTIWLATLPDDGPSGALYGDKQQLDW